LLDRYHALAGACLTTCFLLSQRDAACRRLVEAGNPALCERLLPALARGETFTTVGLAQLTTSRQHVKPALIVREEQGHFVVDGVIPWVTGASRAQHLLVGAAQEDGRQLLLMMPAATPGVEVTSPLELMALRGSLTAEVRCTQVRVDREWLVAGPAERVLQTGRGGPGGLETSCLALGLAAAAVDYVQGEAATRPALESIAARLRQMHGRLRQELAELAAGDKTPDAATAMRGQANTLVLRATQAALTAAKGSGFVRPHPAQRWARQALFFLVWSCPWPAAAATLAHLNAAGPEECT
jgi:alkylation response protein AidB-like acyl-CoA dehydrogenase